MKPQLYQEFLSKKHLNKERAKTALSEFIASFADQQEKAEWARWFLEKEDFGHEIYREIIFPFLVGGYKNGDAWAILHLARTINNLASENDLHSQINFASSTELLKQSYALAPNEEVRDEILRSDLQFYAYSAHEWPVGILWGHNGATIEQCQQLIDEVRWTRTLDKEGTYKIALDDYENKVREYQQRLAFRS